ncbi:dTDP-4-dehydrorhamnose reductase [Candidatus Azobacteroides pseudotrichonymphae]|uniref:dTDP-4-dehydrorhamnose reductase n=1 Tax=Azobacteroides pseudotrichonymphae genomovar. CFP2 TaxID=511995 RepID=B6YQT4_AZOPC|nr:dTDP-4-dehydrorhamnose reductase [Candidatus Azobacteroides pseudotrichonymphae]BAG83556.1 dTDP-4-dehydrorhamnose reductase [Candidatus Azobacteroides pseudotrichonymphae genomovar. CFP2]
MTKTVLVTGAKGQLGCELTKVFTQHSEFNFIPTDIDTLDLTNKKEVIHFVKKHKIDYIINCAAYTAVDKAEEEIDLCYLINRDAVKNIVEAAARGKAKIIHISTNYVFDGVKNTPYIETDITNPQSVYGKSKLEGENTLMKNCPESIIIRTSWLYSIYGYNFVKKILRLIKEKSEINVVCDQIGTPTFAPDLANTILVLITFLKKTKNFHSGIFHYSNEGIVSWFDFAKKILQLSETKNCKIRPITTEQYPIRAKRPFYSALNKKKIKKAFDIVIPNWEVSLKKCINLLTNKS